jgi:hypothetical protein
MNRILEVELKHNDVTGRWVIKLRTVDGWFVYASAHSYNKALVKLANCRG